MNLSEKRKTSVNNNHISLQIFQVLMPPGVEKGLQLNFSNAVDTGIIETGKEHEK